LTNTFVALFKIVLKYKSRFQKKEDYFVFVHLNAIETYFSCFLFAFSLDSFVQNLTLLLSIHFLFQSTAQAKKTAASGSTKKANEAPDWAKLNFWDQPFPGYAPLGGNANYNVL
jgi:hypothetical protein